MYEIQTSEIFEKKFEKLIPKNKQEDIKARIRKLSDNPYVGKPLRYDFVRELKLDKFRIYFIIYKKRVVVFLVNISDKKTQATVINLIIDKYIKNLNLD